MRFLKQAAMVLALPVILATLVTDASAQGVQTGELTGIVSSSDGLTLPGATVTARSHGAAGRANGSNRRERRVMSPRAAARHL